MPCTWLLMVGTMNKKYNFVLFERTLLWCLIKLYSSLERGLFFSAKKKKRNTREILKNFQISRHSDVIWAGLTCYGPALQHFTSVFVNCTLAFE